MTEFSLRDRPASNHQRSEAFDRAVAILAEGTERFDYPVVPKGSISEQYDQSLLKVACVLDWPDLTQHEVSVGVEHDVRRSIGRHDLRLRAATPYPDLSIYSDREAQFGGQKQLVLIRDVQSVKVVKGKFAAGKGLQFSKYVVENGAAGPTCWGLSVDGAFRAWPVAEEWELNAVRPDAAVVLDHDPVRVIQADTEIVDGVTDYERGHIWQGKAELRDPFPRVGVHFAPHGFEVSFDVSRESYFKLADVMIGPFYFEKRPAHREVSHG